MLDGLIIFMYYFGPLWYYVSYKTIEAMRFRVIQKIFAIGAGLGVSFITGLEFAKIIGLGIPTSFDQLLGWYSLPWSIMWFIGLFIMNRRGHPYEYSILMTSLATVCALAIWEIPIHVVTVYLNPTLYQLALTTMLAVPYTIMIIPLRLELRKGLAKKWRHPLRRWIIDPIILGLVFVSLELFNIPSNLFQANGYPIQIVQYVLRVGYAGVFLEVLWLANRELARVGKEPVGEAVC